MSNQYSNPWKDSEIATLKNEELSNREVSELTGRSYQAVKIKRAELGIVHAKKDIQSWTPEEIKTLIKNKHLNNQDLAKLMNRSVQAISLKRNKLKIPYAENLWDQEEIEYLVENYGVLTNKEIAIYLGRTVSSIGTMAYDLGVTKRTDYWSAHEIEVLSNNFEASLDDLEKLIPNKKRKQIIYKRCHITYTNKRNLKEDAGVTDKIKYSKKSKVGEMLILLNALEVGESFEVPNKEYAYYLEAKKFIKAKIFTSKKETELTRRVWRLD